MNAALYARVSTEQQAKNDLSIPAQIDQMKGYCKKKGWRVVQEFREEGKSGTNTNRPELKALLDLCKKTKQVQVVVVHKIDRLARNVYDYAAIKAILKNRNIRVVSVVEKFEDNITGKLVENIVASISQFYSENLSEEVKKGMNMKVKKGGWPNKAPLGYRNARDAAGRAFVEINPDTAPKIVRAFELYARGDYGFGHVGEELFDLGIKSRGNRPLSPQKIKNMLGNPFYTGRMVWNKGSYDGTHEPIIGTLLFAQVQKIMERRSSNTGEKGHLTFLLRGVAYCATCKAKLTAERHPKGNYYRCLPKLGRPRCQEPYPPVEVLDRQLEDLYRDLIPPNVWLNWVKKEMAEIAVSREKLAKEEIEPLEKRLEKTKGMELKLVDEFTAGAIRRDLYEDRADGYARDITRMTERLATLKRDYRKPLSVFDKCIVISSGLYGLHRKFDLDGKKDLLTAVFERIEVRNRQIVSVKCRPPFDFLFKDGLDKRFEDLPPAPTKALSLECHFLNII